MTEHDYLKDMLGSAKDMETRAALLVNALLLPRRVISICDKRGSVVGVFCLDNGRWVLCGETLVREARDILKNIGFEDMWTPGFEREVRRKIVEKTFREIPEPYPPLTPEQEKLADEIEEAMCLGLMGYRHYSDETHDKVVEKIFSTYAPKIYRAFSSWVGDRWKLLLEIIGYIMYPDYEFHKAIMLVGSENSGKPLFMRLLIDLVEPRNMASIGFEELADSGSSAAAGLYGKLANIYPSLPRHPHISEERFKALLGENALCTYREHGDLFCFMNRAKLIYGAEEFPEPLGDAKAFWKRWIVVEFPNEFPADPDIYEKTFTKKEIKIVVKQSIPMFMRALRRGSFSI